jgi:hypothetical protein
MPDRSTPITRIDVGGEQQLMVGEMAIPEHVLPPHDRPESSNRACHGLRHGPKRDAERVCDVAIRQSGRTQMQALTITVGQRTNDGNHLAMALEADERALWIIASGVRTYGLLDSRETICIRAFTHALFERQVVGDSEKPALQVGPSLARQKVLVQRDERVLHDILSLAGADDERAHIAKQRISEGVEECEHVCLEIRVVERGTIQRDER